MKEDEVYFGGTVDGRGGVGFFVAFGDEDIALAIRKDFKKMLEMLGLKVKEEESRYDKKE